MPEDDTFQEYLERAEKAGSIDFGLRIMRTPEGLLDICLHPLNRDGETGDFSVNGSFVLKLQHGAGSSRRAIKFVGS